MNSSSIAGFGLGLGVAAAALVGLAVLTPAPPPPEPEAVPELAEPLEERVPREAVAPEVEIDLPPEAVPEPEAAPESAPEVETPPEPEAAPGPEVVPEPEVTPQPEAVPEPDSVQDPAESLLPDDPQLPDPSPDTDAPQVAAPDAMDVEEEMRPAIAEAAPPSLPPMPDIGVTPQVDASPRTPQDISPPVTTPTLPLLPQMQDAGVELPRRPDPAPQMTEAPDPAVPDGAEAPEPEAPDPAEAAEPAPEVPAIALPGRPVPAMPGQWQPPSDAPADAPQPEADTAPLPALQRNAVATRTVPGVALMGLILHDPGLPTPLRRELAAREIDFSVALNPMDPSAGGAAEIYREAGKEVLILANGIPAGADASDLDVTFSSFFETLPQAVAVMDLPTGGFTRNAQLLQGILPLIARDGHGLVSFAGGTGQAARSAAAADIPHAEVFRVLDASEESPFTIRRFLDRAVFQASQVGYVLVFGDASNDAMLEAIDLWQEMGRVDDIRLAPISAILLRE